MQKIRLALLRRQHISVFIATFSCGILLGVALAVNPSLTMLNAWSWMLGTALLLLLCFWQRATWMLSLVIIAGTIVGLVRASPDTKDLLQYQAYVGQTVELNGVVSDDIDTGKKNDSQIKVNDVQLNGQKLSGTIWVSTYEKVDIKRSYQIELKGKLQKGFGNFAASIFQAKILKVADKKNDKARETRDTFASAIRKNITEPEASLGVGYLVGQRSTLPTDFENNLRIAGLTHVVVASGYNLTILVRFARRLFAPISKYLAALSSGAMIGGFVMVTGFSPSMTRAGLVAGLSLAAWYYGRSIHPLVLLPFVAALTVLIHPSFMWGDLGWYLSFAAFAGVMILAPLLQNYFFGAQKPSSLRQIVGETISAQLVTLPIIAFSFGTIALFALPANILVLPFVPFAMALSAIAGVATLITPGIADAAAQPAQWLLSYMVEVVNQTAALPNANIEISFGLAALLISYVMIVLVAIYLQHATKHNFRKDNIVE